MGVLHFLHCIADAFFMRHFIKQAILYSVQAWSSIISEHAADKARQSGGGQPSRNLQTINLTPAIHPANLLDYYLHPTSRLMWWLEIPKVFLTATPAQTQMQPYGVYGLQRPSHVFLTMLLRSWRSLRLILMIRNGFMPSIMQADGIISRF